MSEIARVHGQCRHLQFGLVRIGVRVDVWLSGSAAGQLGWTASYHRVWASVNMSYRTWKVSLQHRVHFATEAEAQTAGYPLAGTCP